MKYAQTEFHCLFDLYDDAVKFSQDPYFRDDNPHQNAVAPTIAKAPGLPYVVAFTLYHGPDDTEKITTLVRELVKRYDGTLDGDPEPDPAAAAEQATAEPAPVKDSAPWQS